MNELEKLNLSVPDMETYEKMKNKKIKKIYIKCLYKLRGIDFFISDDKGQLFLKCTRSLSPFKEKYVLLTPFKQEIGHMIYRGKPYRYDIYLNNSDFFSIVYSKNDKKEVLFDLSPLPILLKGDIYATNFQVLDKDKDKELAKVNYCSKGDKGLVYEIEWKATKYHEEIISAVIATKLIQFHTMD